MGTLERREILTHRLGEAGRMTVKSVTGVLRVRGIDGEEARVTVLYRIRATDQTAAERALDSGRVLVSRSEGELFVETPERRLSTGLAWLFGGARVNADILVEVPRGTTLTVETMTGSIEAQDLGGQQRYKSISGEIRLWGLCGGIEAGTVSGGISLDGAAPLRLRANTISGGIRARAPLFLALSLNTTSGGMTVVGNFDPGTDHRVETISGGLDVTTQSGVTVELRTVSGSIHGPISTRIEGTRGNWRGIAGDGRARIAVNSTSGSVRLMPPSNVVSEPAGGDRAGVFVAHEPAPSSDQPAPAAAPESAESGEPAPGPQESWSEESAEEKAELDAADLQEDSELSVLRALERGEIGVDEAAARLDESHEPEE